MKAKEKLKELEQRKKEIISHTNEIDEQLRTKKISEEEHTAMITEQYEGKNKEQLMKEVNEEKHGLEQRIKHHEKTKRHIGVASVILIILAVISIFSQYAPESPTGFAVGAKQVTRTLDYNRVFEHETETLLDITNITSLKISGELTGTRATIKLRANGIQYIVADIVNEQQENLITGLAIAEEPSQEYTLSTDKKEYALGETVYITITPEAEDKSLYIAYEDETRKLEDNTYITQQPGEHQVIALIVLPEDILRLEANFTVINDSSTNESINVTENESINTTETNVSEHSQANDTINQTTNSSINTTQQITAYEFSKLCLETCNLQETSNPVLIIELEENSILTITEIIIVQNKENSAPTQTKTIPDITITTAQTANLNLGEYFSDPDEDLVAYDINEIPEISTEITQETLTITSGTTGIYTAYIYATDGDKLVISNTFEIRVIEQETNQTLNETINITIPSNETTSISQPTNITTPANQTIAPAETTDACSNPKINLRPAHCFVGIEDKVFQDLSATIENLNGGTVGRFTRYGNLVIKGLLVQNTTGSPEENDFKIGYSETQDFEETRTYTAWINSKTGNLYLRGRVYQEQDILSPPRYNTYIIQNKFGIVLGYFNELTGDLYLKGNLVQLGKI